MRRWLAPLVLLLAGALGAQEPVPTPGRVVGRVSVAGTSVGLAYAVVSVPALGLERFTDAGGGFVLGGLPPGAHRLRVRRVGYEPRDTVVSVDAGATTGPIDVGLLRVAVQLAAVRVRARRECSRPGPPDARVDPVAAALFEQVKQNAERARLLAEQHAYVYAMERSFGDPRANGEYVFTAPETLVVTSLRTWRYRAGRVVDRDTTRKPPEWVVHLPTLLDVADSAFLHTHCFDYVGLDTLYGQTMARVNVTAGRALSEPDVEGAIYLDSASYQIRWTAFELTRPERVESRVRGVRRLRVQTQFQEVLPSLPIISGIRAVTTTQRTRRARPVEGVETQFLVRFEWTGLPP